MRSVALACAASECGVAFRLPVQATPALACLAYCLTWA